MAQQKNKLQLPKSVLDMKFMKKTKDRIEKELANTKDHKDLYSNIITDEMRQASGNFITEASYVLCEELIEGRLSFKGMNPEIERLMELANPVQDGEMGKDITDDDLAKSMKVLKRPRPSTPPAPPQKKSSKKHPFKKRRC